MILLSFNIYISKPQKIQMGWRAWKKTQIVFFNYYYLYILYIIRKKKRYFLNKNTKKKHKKAMDVYLMIELFLENHCGRTLSEDKETLGVMASAFCTYCTMWSLALLVHLLHLSLTAWRHKQLHWRPWPWGTRFHHPSFGYLYTQ